MGPREKYRRAVDALNEAMLDDARWPETSARIDEACGAKGSLLTFGDKLSKSTQGGFRILLARSYYRGVDRGEWQREYFRNYYAHDEHLPRLRALPDGQIAHVPDLFSAEELKTSRMFNEALARFDGQNGLNVRLDGPGSAYTCWGIANPIDARGWSASRVRMVQRLLPHLRQYIAVRSALVDAEALSASVAALLDNARACVIQLDRNGEIVETSDRARDLLRANDGLSDRDGALRATMPEDNAALQKLLQRALPRCGEPGASGSMMIRRALRLPRLAVHVKPATQRERDRRSRRVAALVLIADPMDRSQVAPGLVQAALGLSSAEAEIATLLAAGLTPRQIAARTGRGYSTVRTHLKHIFTKLGVSRQFEVAQLVFALAKLPIPWK